MSVTKALEILKQNLIGDVDVLKEVENILHEVAHSSYHAGLRDADSEKQIFTSYGSTQDW